MFFLIGFEEVFIHLKVNIAAEFSATHFLQENAFLSSDWNCLTFIIFLERE